MNFTNEYFHMTQGVVCLIFKVKSRLSSYEYEYYERIKNPDLKALGEVKDNELFFPFWLIMNILTYESYQSHYCMIH